MNLLDFLPDYNDKVYKIFSKTIAKEINEKNNKRKNDNFKGNIDEIIKISI
jgi:hypothetical protein